MHPVSVYAAHGLKFEKDFDQKFNSIKDTSQRLDLLRE